LKKFDFLENFYIFWLEKSKNYMKKLTPGRYPIEKLTS